MALTLAGLASYWATKSLQEHYVSIDEQRAREADNYRHARQQFASDQGRPLTAAENAYLAERFKAALAAVGHTQTGRFGRI
jgi:hypothetical protein